MDANTPATQPFPSGDPIGNNPIQDSPTQKSPSEESPSKDNPNKDKIIATARPKGPKASAIVVGLVAMLLAGLIIAKETMGLRVDWSRLGPGAIVGIGVVMVAIGAIGLVRRHDDV